MVDVRLVAALVLMSLAFTLIAIASIISFSIAGKLPAGDTKKRLRASAILTMLTGLFAVGTGVAGYLYARAKAAASTSVRTLLIVFLVLATITFLMYVTVLGLSLSVRARTEITTVNKNALTAGIIMIAIGFIALIIATILFIMIKRKPAVVVAKKTTTVTTKPVESAPAVSETTTTTETAVVPKPLPKRPTRAIAPSRIVQTTTTTAPRVGTAMPAVVISSP
jgi:hypothetical protein